MPSGVRRVLDNAADRAFSSRHAEFLYLSSLFVTGAVSAGPPVPPELTDRFRSRKSFVNS